MKLILPSLSLAAVLILFLAACGSKSGNGDVEDQPTGPAPATNATSVDGVTALRLVITLDSSIQNLEDEELSPILERITPQLEESIGGSELPEAEVLFIAPRSIVVELEGDAAVVIPRIQQLITAGNYEIPLSVTQLQTQ